MRKKGMGATCLILAAAVLTAGIWAVKFRVTERKATRAEIEAHEAYLVDWSRFPSRQEGMTDKELILSLCQVAEQGEDPAVFYTSDSLGKLLRQCETVEEISLADGILAVTYMTGDGKRVTLRYGDDGNTGLWVHDTKKDTLYARTGDGATVTTNYYKGLRMRVE